MIGISGGVGAALGAVLGAVLGLGLFALMNVVWLLPAAREEGRAAYIAERAAADLKAEQERKTEDAKLQRMSDYDLCVRSLGRVPECAVFMHSIRSK